MPAWSKVRTLLVVLEPTVCAGRFIGRFGERVLGVADELQEAWKSGNEVSDASEALWEQGGICETTGDS